jgi:hypothetical protein
MEDRGLATIGGLLKDSPCTRLRGYDDYGSDSIDTLPPNAAFQYGFLRFTAKSNNPTLTFNTGSRPAQNVVINDGNGYPIQSLSVQVNVNQGDLITLSLTGRLTGGISNISATGGIDDLEFSWESIGAMSSIDLNGLGITNPIQRDFPVNEIITIDLRGNTIGGDFPDVQTFNLYLNDNRFTGSLPRFYPDNQVVYQVNGNAFRGDIPDISSSTTIRSFLCYNQNDDESASTSNPRIMLTGTIPDLSACSELRFFHVGAGPSWQKGFKNDLSVAADFDVNVRLDKFFASNCLLSTEDVDRVLAAFASRAGTFLNPQTIDLSGSNGSPTSTGLLNKDILESSGWTVKVSS